MRLTVFYQTVQNYEVVSFKTVTLFRVLRIFYESKHYTDSENVCQTQDLEVEYNAYVVEES